MGKLKILIDMDDTIEDLLTSWTEYLNKKHGQNMKPEEVDEWDLSKSYPTLSEADLYAPLFDGSMWDDVKPIEGAQEYIKKLIEDGHEIYIVTASHYGSVTIKCKAVIEKYFPFIGWENIIVASNKQMILGDVLVDDAVHNLLGGRYAGVLFDRPHNRSYDESGGDVFRALSWKEVYEYIKDLSELQDNAIEEDDR